MGIQRRKKKTDSWKGRGKKRTHRQKRREEKCDRLGWKREGKTGIFSSEPTDRRMGTRRGHANTAEWRG